MDILARALFTPAAVMLDNLLGEPSRYHPLVGFGHLATKIEQHAYGPEGLSPAARRMRGIAAVALLLMPAFTLASVMAYLPFMEHVMSLAGLYLALGAQSLREHAEAVRRSLAAGELTEARRAIGLIVSRDTRQLDEGKIVAATVESVLENGCDAIFGALFWFVVGGLPGVIVYRLANTLDAMWGYRNERYREFGWAAARFDDMLNFVPARLTALGYALCGNMPVALRAWQTQGNRWKSPNAGPVMAAGAGALNIRLGGPAVYHGSLTHRPALGFGRPAETRDITRALELLQRSLLLWLFFIVTGGLLLA